MSNLHILRQARLGNRDRSSRSKAHQLLISEGLSEGREHMALETVYSVTIGFGAREQEWMAGGSTGENDILDELNSEGLLALERMHTDGFMEYIKDALVWTDRAFDERDLVVYEDIGDFTVKYRLEHGRRVRVLVIDRSTGLVRHFDRRV